MKGGPCSAVLLHSVELFSVSRLNIVDLAPVKWRPTEHDAPWHDTKSAPIHFPWDTNKSFHKALWDFSQRRTTSGEGRTKKFKWERICLVAVLHFSEKQTTKEQCSGGSQSLVFTCCWDMSVRAKVSNVLSVIPFFYVPGLQAYRYKQKGSTPWHNIM